MKQEALDTNVLLRFLVGDNEKHKAQAERWFREAEEGTRKIVILPIVVAESAFVLESFYKKTRSEIVQAFVVLLSQRWLDVREREVLVRLWTWYEQGLHFVDSFLLAWSQVNEGGILTFDVDIRKKSGD